jgi:fumarylacetoacetate (FAA) hydrolase family protein
MKSAGIVPNYDFTHAPGDRIIISIDNIGTLEDRVSVA